MNWTKFKRITKSLKLIVVHCWKQHGKKSKEKIHASKTFKESKFSIVIKPSLSHSKTKFNPLLSFINAFQFDMLGKMIFCFAGKRWKMLNLRIQQHNQKFHANHSCCMNWNVRTMNRVKSRLNISFGMMKTIKTIQTIRFHQNRKKITKSRPIILEI